MYEVNQSRDLRYQIESQQYSPSFCFSLFVNFSTSLIPPSTSILHLSPTAETSAHFSPRLPPFPFHLVTPHPRMSVMNNNTAGHSRRSTAADPAQSQLNLSSPHVDPHQLDHISIHSPRRILFLYGSQTGCAQDVAENAAREARRMHFSASVSSMDDYDRVRRPCCVRSTLNRIMVNGNMQTQELTYSFLCPTVLVVNRQ